MCELPTGGQISQASEEMGLGIPVSELHGALCGWLAGGGNDAPDWLNRVLVDPDLPVPAPDSALDRLRKNSAAQLFDGSFSFALLLPDRETPLDERAQALFDWCTGFLGGFGLAAGAEPPLSEEGREALQDLAQLASASVEGVGGDEDEVSLSELEEFVRVAVLLLHGDCVLAPRYRQRLN
ncbi:MAG: UPF0149 family protein [Xanthomonadaceae bacterium]|nr:UPF0149 family protein [Xanthomonadaceae bacterium]